MGQPKENETENFDVVTSETDVIQGEAGEKSAAMNEQKKEEGSTEAPVKDEEASKEEEDKGKKEDAAKDAEDTSAEKKRAPSRFQKRIDRKVKQAAAANKRAGAAEAENERLKKELEKSKAVKADKGEEPEPSDFDNYDDYLKAMDDSNGKKPEEKPEPKAKEEPEKVNPEPESDEELDDALDDLEESFSAAKEKYDDFDDVTGPNNKELIVTRDMVVAMSDADNAGDIAYFLGTNTDEARRISKLSTIAQAKEIAKLEIKLTKKPAPASKATDAPAPIEPVGGSDATNKDPEDMSFKEYEADQRAKSRRGGFW